MVNTTLTVVWLGGALPLQSHDADLESWAAARLVRLEEPSADAPLLAARHDAGAAERVETLLADARRALFGTDPGAAARALDEAEQLLESPVDLPQSAFLRGELWRTRAALVSQEDPARADALRQAALSLDGPFAPAFAEGPSGEGDSAPKSHLNVHLGGPRTGDVVYIDGVPVSGDISARPGRHHVRVLRGARVAWAGWVTLGPDPLPLPMGPPRACSEGELTGVTLKDGRITFAGPVECDDWIAARSAGRDRVEVARCRGSVCGPLLPWSRSWGSVFAPPAQPRWTRSEPNNWLLWTAAGVLASATTGLVLWQSGVFEREGPTQRRFEFVPPERP